MRRTSWFYVALLLIFTVGVAVRAQQPPRAVTAADYARAEKFLAPSLTGLVVGGSVTPIDWNIGRGGGIDDRFVYRATLTDGTTQTLLVDPVRKTRHVCPGEADCAAIPPGDLVPGRAGGEGAGRGGGRGGRGGGATGTVLGWEARGRVS